MSKLTNSLKFIVFGGALVLGGCINSTPKQPPPTSSNVQPTTTPTIVRSTGPGWSGTHLDGTPFTNMSCHSTMTTYQGITQPLPDPNCTPGAVNATITQANLSSTICRKGGYTKSVRPNWHVTERAKYQAMHAYGYHGSAQPYEFDHLIPLELGGSSNTANLWPELNVGPKSSYINNTKDAVEFALHNAVCSGQVSLTAAQNDIATNWTTAEAKLGVNG